MSGSAVGCAEPAANRTRPEPPQKSAAADREIIIATYHFFPSPEVGAKRMTALAEHLLAHGQRVAVVSAFQGLPASGNEDARWHRLKGYHLERVAERQQWAIGLLVRAKGQLRRLLRRQESPARPGGNGANLGEQSPRSGVSSLHRTVFAVIHTIDDKKRWAIDAARCIIARAARSPASLIVVSAPPMSPLFGAVWAARRLRLPVIVDLRDPLYIEGSSDSWESRWRERWAPRLLERYVMRRADAVVTTSPSLRDQLRVKYPGARGHIFCIQNGFDGQARAPRAATDHRLVMVYAGALYLNRNPFPFLEAIDDLLQQPEVDTKRIELVLAGECAYYAGISVADWLATRRCSRVVTLQGTLDADELQRLYERATLLVNFAEGQHMQVPAKTFELLALGREVLVLCEPDSDTARVIAGLTGVTTVRSSDVAQLRGTLRDLYWRHAVEGRLCAPSPDAITRFSRATQNERFNKLIRHVASGAAARLLDLP